MEAEEYEEVVEEEGNDAAVVDKVDVEEEKMPESTSKTLKCLMFRN